MKTITNKSQASLNVRKMTMTALLGALATVLMFISFKVPLMPSFISMDFSELPALIAAFSLGPVSGVVVCLIKNLANLFASQTGGVGELSNFLLGTCFVLPAGLIYRYHKSRKGALIGALLGAVCMAVVSAFTNYFIVYPIYTNFLPMEAIMGMYQAINPHVETLWEALWVFNVPFTFIKGMCSVLITFLVYKKISPLIQGKNL
ncbi:MAG: ECF transporter S component [Candidatus Merdivicinus sp.]